MATYTIIHSWWWILFPNPSIPSPLITWERFTMCQQHWGEGVANCVQMFLCVSFPSPTPLPHPILCVLFENINLRHRIMKRALGYHCFLRPAFFLHQHHQNRAQLLSNIHHPTPFPPQTTNPYAPDHTLAYCTHPVATGKPECLVDPNELHVRPHVCWNTVCLLLYTCVCHHY